MKRIFLYLNLSLAILISSCGGGSDVSVKLIPIANGNQYGYIDWEGKIIINPQFSEAGLFMDDVALIKTSGSEPLYGYIDTKGSYIINPQYIYATDFVDGIALTVKPNEAPKGINKKGEVVFEVKNAQSVTNFHEGLAAYSVENEQGTVWGFIDDKGTSVITPQFQSVGKFSEGKAAFMNKEGKWGFIDKTGKIVINNQFSRAGIFKNGKAVAFDSNSKAGLIDEKGKYLINPQFQQMIPDGKNFIIASGSKCGWVDSEGTIIINPQFDGVMPFGSNDIAPVRQDDQWGYIDRKGKYEINPQFGFAYPFVSGKAIVSNGSDVGIIDKKGGYVVNPQFNRLSGSYNSFALADNAIQTVVSDYFDVESIANGIKKEITPNTVSGFTFATPLSEMISKYPSYNFNYYYNSSNLFQNQPINKYADLSLSVEGAVYVQSGWSYIPNPNATVEGFLYLIQLKGKAISKTDQILKSLENGFSGFQKVNNPSGGRFQFSNQNSIITVGIISGQIAVRVNPNTNTATENSSETVSAENVQPTTN